MFRNLASFVLALALPVDSAAQAADNAMRVTDTASVSAIVHGAIVPMDVERVLGGHTVLVRGGRIAWMGPDSVADVPEGAQVIDASGRWIVPGLADMHVHAGAEDFPAFLANGVTTIREMNGTPDHLEWRRAAGEGRLTAPSLIVTGPLIAGEEQRWRHVLARTPEEGRALVRKQARSGFDAIKIYDGLSRETYDAIAATADSLRIPLVGHLPREVGLARALEAGQRSIEHVGQIAHALPSAHGLGAVEPGAMAAIAEQIEHAGAWVTPTLASEEALSSRGTSWYEERLARPEVELVDPGLIGWWRSLGQGAPDSAAAERRQVYREGVQALVRALRDAGVPLLAGTDTPNPLMVPGFSLHEELAALVEAGLSPYEAVSGATAEAARFADQEAEFGTIRVGARADLLVLSGDPLADVGALRRLEGVMLRGEWLPRERLDAFVREALAARDRGAR
jgi:imidazolonepropionase-like amidohydrolase